MHQLDSYHIVHIVHKSNRIQGKRGMSRQPHGFRAGVHRNHHHVPHRVACMTAMLQAHIISIRRCSERLVVTLGKISLGEHITMQ
jgi:hypothetical protein